MLTFQGVTNIPKWSKNRRHPSQHFKKETRVSPPDLLAKHFAPNYPKSHSPAWPVTALPEVSELPERILSTEASTRLPEPGKAKIKGDATSNAVVHCTPLEATSNSPAPEANGTIDREIRVGQSGVELSRNLITAPLLVEYYTFPGRFQSGIPNPAQSHPFRAPSMHN